MHLESYVDKISTTAALDWAVQDGQTAGWID